MKLIKKTIKWLGEAMIPYSIKNFLIRIGFFLMTEDQRDIFRLSFQMASIDWSLKNLRLLGFNPGNIIDIGAYVGNWTRLAKKTFPESNILMIEAQPDKIQSLEKVITEFPGTIMCKNCLLGPEKRDGVSFFLLETGSSVLYEQSDFSREKVTYPMITLDDLMLEVGWFKADFIKLDVQGYELEVLKGAEKILQTAEVILMEVSLIKINQGAPLVSEVLEFMEKRGFRLYDICSFIRRPSDNALWQSDMLFVRNDSAMLENTRFS